MEAYYKYVCCANKFVSRIVGILPPRAMRSLILMERKSVWGSSKERQENEFVCVKQMKRILFIRISYAIEFLSYAIGHLST